MMSFPQEFIEKFSVLGLDVESFYKTSIRRCFRVHQSGVPIEGFKMLETVPWYREQAYFYQEEDHEKVKKLFLEGRIYIQDAASLIAPLVLNPEPQHRVLDCCAAPGTKTLHLSSLMDRQGDLIANESYRSRFFRLVSNLKRFDASHVTSLNHDARYLIKLFKKESFDRILLDAPCGGEGMVPKIHKVLKMWSVKRIRKLSILQKQLLKTAYRLLKPNGILVYSTCTVAPEENEEVVQHLLMCDPSARINPISVNGLKTRPGLTMWKDQEYNKCLESAIRIYPEDYGTDGFFIAKIRKESIR